MADEKRFEKIVVGGLGVVLNPKDEVLFIKQRRGPFAGSWLLPGGGIEYGEKASEAARREILEETGIDAGYEGFLAVYEMRGEWRKGRYHILMMTFRFESDLGVPENFEGHNVDGIMWSNPENIELHPTDMRILNDAGVTDFSEEEILSALEKDGITMNSYGNGAMKW